MKKSLFNLIPFDTNKDSMPNITVSGSLVLNNSNIEINYQVTGDLDKVALSSESPTPGRKNQLWEKTCFELFITNPESPMYWEYNLSPSHDWSVFRFSDYRQEKTDELSVDNIVISTGKSVDKGLSIQSLLPLPVPLIGKKLQIGISAVIQDTHDVIYYYALAHLQQQADFHDKNSFTISLE